jgi:hypothetical protein
LVEDLVGSGEAGRAGHERHDEDPACGAAHPPRACAGVIP